MNRTLISWALVLTLLLAVVGCNTVKPESIDEKYNREMLLTSDDARAMGYRLTWAYDLDMDANSKVSSVDLLDDIVVAIEKPSSLVTNIGVKDGAVQWRSVVGEPTNSLFSPVRKAKLLFFAGETRFYRVDEPSGKVLDISLLKYPVIQPPVLIGDLAIFGSRTGRVFAHDTRTGHARWIYRMTSDIIARPAANGNQVFVADSKGVYAMFDANSGEAIWRGRAFGAIWADPVITRSGVFAASHDYSFYSFDRATGRDRNGWPFRSTVPLKLNPYAVGNSIYLPVEGTGLTSIDPVNGAQLWVYPKIVQPVNVDANNRLLISTGTSFAYLDNQTGKLINEVKTKQLSSVIRGEGFLILVSPTGRIQRYDAIK